MGEAAFSCEIDWRVFVHMGLLSNCSDTFLTLWIESSEPHHAAQLLMESF